MTHALLWARRHAALKTQMCAVDHGIHLAQAEYIKALERLARCHLTPVAQSEHLTHIESAAQVKVDEEDQEEDVIVRALDETTLEVSNMDIGS